MNILNALFTSESASTGHSAIRCECISDAIFDQFLTLGAVPPHAHVTSSFTVSVQ
jgi:S-adenosylmethionine synthetase